MLSVAKAPGSSFAGLALVDKQAALALLEKQSAEPGCCISATEGLHQRDKRADTTVKVRRCGLQTRKQKPPSPLHLRCKVCMLSS